MCDKINSGFANLVEESKQRLSNGESPFDVFDFFDGYCEGYGAVKLYDKWNYIDTKGNIISKQWFTDVYDFENGIAKVKRKDRRLNFLKSDGTFVSDFWFDYVGEFVNGYAVVIVDGDCNYIDTTGTFALSSWCRDVDELYKSFNTNMVRVNFKKLTDEAVTPTKSNVGDAGFDLTATSKSVDEYGNYVYGTGLAVEIPYGYVGLIFPRSSIFKQDLTLTNSVGVIDSGYRGEILFKFKRSLKMYKVEGGDYRNDYHSLRTDDDKYSEYNVGDRIGQLIIIPIPEIKFIEKEELSDSSRGDAGFGSSGN